MQIPPKKIKFHSSCILLCHGALRRSSWWWQPVYQLSCKSYLVTQRLHKHQFTSCTSTDKLRVQQQVTTNEPSEYLCSNNNLESGTCLIGSIFLWFQSNQKIHKTPEHVKQGLYDGYTDFKQVTSVIMCLFWFKSKVFPLSPPSLSIEQSPMREICCQLTAGFPPSQLCIHWKLGYLLR